MKREEFIDCKEKWRVKRQERNSANKINDMILFEIKLKLKLKLRIGKVNDDRLKLCWIISLSQKFSYLFHINYLENG